MPGSDLALLISEGVRPVVKEGMYTRSDDCSRGGGETWGMGRAEPGKGPAYFPPPDRERHPVLLPGGRGMFLNRPRKTQGPTGKQHLVLSYVYSPLLRI